MIEINPRKKIFRPGDIVEISPLLAQNKFFTINVRLKDFKDNSRFFMIMYDKRKSNRMYYHFELIQLKDNMKKEISKRAFRTGSFSREDLVFWNDNGSIIKKLDEVETAILYLSSPIQLRRNYG